MAAVRVLDRLCELSLAEEAPEAFTAVDILDALGSEGSSGITVAEVLDALLKHELVSSAGEIGGRPVYVVHPEARPF